MSWLVIIFWILLLDALIANVLAFGGKQHWWQQHFGAIAKHLPLARGWTVFYLLLVILVGIILGQNGHDVLPF